MNPYWGTDFFGFFATLVSRFFQFVTKGSTPLATDELQLLVLVTLSITASFIGTFFVLRKMTMLANALSHTILPGVVIAYLAYHYMYTPQGEYDFSHLLPSDSLLILAALGSALVTTFLIHLIVTHLPVAVDASIGMVFTLLFAFGIILVTSLTKSSHIGAELLMGNVDALHYDDLVLMFWILIVTVIGMLIFWRKLFATSFDPLFASMCGMSNTKMSYFLMGLVSLCAIGAFRAVGVLLFLAFLVTPPLIARRLTNRLTHMVALSCLVGVIASLVGVALSRHILSYYDEACSTAGLVVTILAIMYGLSLAITRPFSTIKTIER